MEFLNLPKMPAMTSKPQRLLARVSVVTIAIFGALVAALTWRLRHELRDEVLRREAEAVHAVALMQLRLAEERGGPLEGAIGLEQAFQAVLESSKLRGVVAVHVFAPGGELYAALPVWPAERRWSGATAVPQAPRATFRAEASLEGALGLAVEPGAEPTRAPLLEIVVPLRVESAALGVARYWTDGAPVGQEFARIDRRLAWQAGVAFLGGAVLIALVIAAAARRLAAANRLLEEQRADLARANEELDFAAKTGALGAISAHLIHGLKNPLAGIEGFVAETATGAPDALRGEACRTAVETTRRLRALVNEVTSVLRDEAAGEGDYPVPVGEVLHAVAQRAAAAAERAGIAVRTNVSGDPQLSGRRANLVGLVLTNLVSNAIEAAPAGSAVFMESRPLDGRVEFVVRDAGPGLPREVRQALFRPVRSTKVGGGGVGLAISHRLARHAGGELELICSDDSGTIFRLAVPALGADVNASSSSGAAAAERPGDLRPSRT